MDAGIGNVVQGISLEFWLATCIGCRRCSRIDDKWNRSTLPQAASSVGDFPSTPHNVVDVTAWSLFTRSTNRCFEAPASALFVASMSHLVFTLFPSVGLQGCPLFFFPFLPPFPFLGEVEDARSAMFLNTNLLQKWGRDCT